MAETVLRYSVEVLVHVETDDTYKSYGEVTRVIVCDDITRTEAAPEVTGLDETDPEYDAIVEYAQQVADSRDWPGWEFGY